MCRALLANSHQRLRQHVVPTREHAVDWHPAALQCPPFKVQRKHRREHVEGDVCAVHVDNSRLHPRVVGVALIVTYSTCTSHITPPPQRTIPKGFKQCSETTKQQKHNKTNTHTHTQKKEGKEARNETSSPRLSQQRFFFFFFF